MDAFYAAVEAQRNPALRDRPLVVGADPKEGQGRGVVTAASYAARRYGIRSALPISRAWRLAEAARRRGEPETIFVRDDHALYREVSARIMAILAAAGDAFQKASVDEAYLELSSLGSFDAAVERARRLKAEIVSQEGLTASVGIGPNKLVAKIASDFQKPDGLTVVRPEEVQPFLDPLRIRVIPGIGPKTEHFLHERHIRTVADLRTLERAQLAEWFGRGGRGPLRQGPWSLGERGVERAGAQVRRRAGDVRSRHPGCDVRAGARPRAGPYGVEPAREPRLPCVPDGHGDRPLREFHHLRALANRPRGVDERGGPLRGGARATPALPRRPRESPAPQAPPHRRPRGEALPLTSPRSRSLARLRPGAPGSQPTSLSPCCTRRGGATRGPSRCAPWGRGRATGTCPRGRPLRANRRNRCGRPRRPRARTRSGPASRACTWPRRFRPRPRTRRQVPRRRLLPGSAAPRARSCIRPPPRAVAPR